jgi:hypothetical protein
MMGWAALAGATLGGAGCGGGAQSADGSAPLTQFVDCSKEARATPYAPGTLERSDQGQLDVTLVDNRPGAADANSPPGSWARGSNTWEIEIRDVSGQAVPGLAVEAVPRMPDHGHGTPVTPETTDEAGGRYLITPLYLYMSGYWQVTLNIRPPGSEVGSSAQLHADSVVFNVCIP